MTEFQPLFDNPIISEAHARITRVKGKDYASGVQELQEEVQKMESEEEENRKRRMEVAAQKMNITHEE